MRRLSSAPSAPPDVERLPTARSSSDGSTPARTCPASWAAFSSDCSAGTVLLLLTASFEAGIVLGERSVDDELPSEGELLLF